MIKCLSLFSQILSEVSLSIVSFELLVMKHGNDRGADLYEEYFWKKLQHFLFRDMLEKSSKKFKFKNRLFLFDSKTINKALLLPEGVWEFELSSTAVTSDIKYK